ncbi:MAG: zinc dependent phospholipase C family protein [Anaerolineae bacterium]|jgi:hypothetical protein|nr:zinc dependent phospholipase C family protein [Anaerolineae bacterium]
MPTPFTHLEIAVRLLHDPALNAPAHRLIDGEYAAFLLGSICADARPSPRADREVTHFYRYDRPMVEHPWRVMLAQHPALARPATPAAQAFIAGYVAHLATDEYWSRYMLAPHFAGGTWGHSLQWRFFVLHLLLIFMDERDLKTLTAALAHTLQQAAPQHWLPFMSDAVLCDWRDLIAQQITGDSLTLEIFGGRIFTPPAQLRQMLDSPEVMHEHLWAHITPALLHTVEADMYAFSREQLLCYLADLPA